MRRIGLVVVLALSFVLVPLTARAQLKNGKVYQVGVIATSLATNDVVGPNPPSPTVGALLRGLRDLGYVYGRDFVTVRRWTDGRSERSSGIGAELERLKGDVSVAGGRA